MKYRRYRLQVKARGPIPGYSAHELDWAMPVNPKDTSSAFDDLHFNTEGEAMKEAKRAAMFWAHLRVWDNREKRVIAEWHDGSRKRAAK